MSIYASIPGIGDHGDDEEIGPPWIYRESHILPDQDHPRGGSIGLALIPSHISRDGRDNNPEDAAPWPWLRLDVDVPGNDPTVILSPAQARHLARLLTAWADRAEEQRTPGRRTVDTITSDQLDALYDQLERAQRVAMDALDDGALERVRALHQPMQRGALQVCAHCSGWDEQRQRCFGVLADYPCGTLRALDTQPEPDTAAADLTGYTAPHPAIGCITATTTPTPIGLRKEIAAAIFECPAGYPTDIADAIMPVLYRAYSWMRAEAEDTAPLTSPDRLAQSGIDTPGCTCGHHGMGVSWHGDDCTWRAAVLDGSTPEPTPDGLHAQIAAAIRDCPARYPDDIATAVLAVILPATRITATLARMSDADVSGVIDLHERWVKAGPPPIGTSINRWWDMRLAELHTALSGPQDGPETPDAGTETPDTPNGPQNGADGFDGPDGAPTPADEARLDREYWTQRYDQP